MLEKAYVLYIMEGESVSVQDYITTLVVDFERVTLQCTGTAKPLSGDGLQRYSVSIEHDGLLRKCHGNVL